MPDARRKFERDIDDVRRMQVELGRDVGGTGNGAWLFVTGLVLAAVGLWFFLGNVQVETSHIGAVSGLLSRGMFRGQGVAASTGIVFAPIFIGLVLLFYDARLKWGWALFYVGLALIVIEILSRIQFRMSMPTSNLLLMLGMIAAGIGMMLRSLRDAPPDPPADDATPPRSND